MAEPERPLLSSAPPPYHTVVVWLSLICIFSYLMPSWEKLDEAATIETFTKRWFPDLISVTQLACIRLAFAAFIWMDVFRGVFLTPGTLAMITYLKESKLSKVPVPLKGMRTLCSFTAWSWITLGISFTLSGYIALFAQTTRWIPPAVLRAGLISWEIAAPFTLLVSAVVRYVIWPTLYKNTGKTLNLKSFRALAQHNGNVLFAAVETALLGGLPVRWSDVSFCPLFGCAYILFTWCMSSCWVPDSGPQFIYFFMDTTLPGAWPSLAILALLSVLLMFFALFVSAESVLAAMPGGELAHILFVAGLCSVTMRLQD